MPSPFPGMNPYFEQPGLWLDSKPILDAVYDDSAYHDRLYDAPPDPPSPSSAEDEVWAAGCVSAGLS